MVAGALTLSALRQGSAQSFVGDNGPFVASSTLTSEKFYEFPVQGKDGRLASRAETLHGGKSTRRGRVDSLLALAGERHVSRPTVSAMAVRLNRLIATTDPVTLPALTGEENTYELLARGQVLCTGDSLAALIPQAMAAVAFGNEVVVLKSAHSPDLAARIPGACRVLDATDLASVVRGDIKGVRPASVLSEPSLRSLPQVIEAASKRMTAVVLSDDTGGYDWTALVRERITTVNASAAGGNTQLMVLSEDAI
jgi:RHH-type proline utilization regulon transcriptional repressor/proline dehydrogenase/delta 1-pyrroline-5-carboxylate dehydrogenase